MQSKNIRTDLAVEAHEISKKAAGNADEIDGVTARVYENDGITVTEVKITNEAGERALGKKMGKYVTIDAPDIKYSLETYEKTCKIIADEIRKMTDTENNAPTLVAGLGNSEITPDALGTAVLQKLLVTHHIKKSGNDFLGDKIKSVCAVAPGVLGTTGIESAQIIKAVADKVKPKLIIAVDALAGAAIERLNCTIQISDTGIQPGAGVGNDREEISENVTGAKVIAIGVPTVIDASSISDNEIPEEISPLMVTTKDIDVVIERLAKTIANGINLALHDGMTLREAEEYVG